MKFSAIDAITNNLIAARFWMILALRFVDVGCVQPYFTVIAMRTKEKDRLPDPGGTLIYAPLLGFEEAGQLTPTMFDSPASRSCNAILPAQTFLISSNGFISIRRGRRRLRCIRRETPSSRKSRSTRKSKSPRLPFWTPENQRRIRSLLRSGHGSLRRQPYPDRNT